MSYRQIYSIPVTIIKKYVAAHLIVLPKFYINIVVSRCWLQFKGKCYFFFCPSLVHPFLTNINGVVPITASPAYSASKIWNPLARMAPATVLNSRDLYLFFSPNVPLQFGLRVAHRYRHDLNEKNILNLKKSKPGHIKTNTQSEELLDTDSTERVLNYTRFFGVIISLSCAIVSFVSACFYGYKFMFYIPEPVSIVWKAVKDDKWLNDQLGAPLRISGTWRGFVHEEEAKVNFKIRGSLGQRYGKLYADLIRSANGSEWDILSVRFGRMDAEAEAEGISIIADGNHSKAIFTSTSNKNVKDHKSLCSNNNVAKMRLTDDILAGQTGFSVFNSSSNNVVSTKYTKENASCPYQNI